MKKLVSCLLMFGIALGSTACGSAADTIEKYTLTGFAMDTVIQTTLYTAGEDITSQITEELTSLEKTRLSWNWPGSEIAKINEAAGTSVEITEELSEDLHAILQLAKDSDGALDPTMGNVIRLWDIGGEEPHIPEEAQLQSLLEAVDYQQILLREDQVFLPEGCSLDLGAAGKGIGCDRILELLSADSDIQGALLSMGGSSVMTYGQKPDRSDWNIAIKDPRDPDGEYLGIVALSGTKFLSTSGDYEKYFIQNGVRYHHILDPKTGYPANSGLCSVTVVCDNGLWADGLSTACLILGTEKAAALLHKYNADGLLVDDSGQIYMTAGMEALFSLWKTEYTAVII